MKVPERLLFLAAIAFIFSTVPVVYAFNEPLVGPLGPVSFDNSTNMTSLITFSYTDVGFTFGIMWTNYTYQDAVGSYEIAPIENVTFETNLTTGSSTMINITTGLDDAYLYESFTNDSTTGIWNITFKQSHFAGAGQYAFRWFGNDSAAGVSNVTDTWYINITKGIANVTLYFNGTESNYTYVRGDVANVTGVVNVTGKTVYVRYEYYNGTLEGGYAGLSSGQTSEEVLIDTSSFNSSQLCGYNYTVYFSEDANYTLSYFSWFPAVIARSDGDACTNTVNCLDAHYCVHNYCRAASTYCGDGQCDTGESCSGCPGDCGYCATNIISNPSIGTGSVSISYIPPMVPYTFTTTLKGVPVTHVGVTVNERVSQVKISIEKLDGKPSSTEEITSVSDGNSAVYNYLEINASNLDNSKLANANIKFKVEKSWIDENKVDSSSVVLNRYNGGSWVELETSRIREDNTYIYYEAATPGFSYFAISGAVAGTSEPAATTTTTTVEVPLPDDTGEETEPSTNLLLYIILVIIAMGAYFLLR